MSENIAHPVGGIDYPRDLQEFDEWFSCQADCIRYLQKLRWPNGFNCPVCNGSKAWRMSRGIIWCAKCKRQTSPIAGTIFEGTRKPMRLWFQAIWYITSQKFGGSALGLQRVLGLGSYQTAWSWLHKLRRAMVRPGRNKLFGTVEVDETLVGGESQTGKRGRGSERKTVVVIAIEIFFPKGFGRVRMRRIEDASGSSLIPFVCDSIEPGTIVHTDGWSSYNGIAEFGYTHIKKNISASGDPAHVVMPGVHRISSLLKRWLISTHQGAVSDDHMDYYLDEYAFRFNRRKSKARGMLFYRLLQQAVEVGPVPYKMIIRKKMALSENQ